MTSKIFIDSSFLVEYIKGTKTETLAKLLESSAVELFISETIVSEFLFYFLKINGDASPQSLQSSKKIQNILSKSISQDLIFLFQFLSTDKSIFGIVPQLMKQYNLLPNDAIILATCKIHNITKLASHDSDFIEPCKGEGIELLTE